ncbi:MAG: PilZ domain-containing protein [Phycisphaerae bacterium]|nr:PilZ domain-containing protein [Phycisphaerae bacterium]NUQ44757.1 PilZ domain-containing protein [Phycisphaerae bacterium]
MKYAIDLSERQSQRALNHALQSHAQVVMELTGESNAMTGQFVLGDESILAISLTRPVSPATGGLVGRYVDVQVFADQRYFFTSYVIEDDGGLVEPNQIAIRRPQTIQVLQRRRFWRARVAPSSTVSLSWKSNGAVEERCATLLNLSAEGLACRAPRADVDGLCVGDAVDLRFEIPDGPAPFELTGVVCNKTPGVDATIILGLQFRVSPAHDEATAAQNTLKAWLYQRDSAAVGPEVGV